MTSNELAALLGCSGQYVRELTKQALADGKNYITIKGQKITFCQEAGRGRGGRRYRYTLVKEHTPKKKRRSKSIIDPKSLPAIDFKKPSVEEKVAIIRYYKSHEASLEAIAQAYSIEFEELNAMSLARRFRRWLEAYERYGRAGLEDKRGGKRVSKIDEELFIKSLVKQGHITTYYERYCYMWCKKHGKLFDRFNPTSNVTYEGFKRYFNAHKNDPHIKAILKGPDAMDLLEPTMKRTFEYPNQEWQIDATTIDLFAKVPVVDGEVVWDRKEATPEYVLKRLSLIRIIDSFTGASIVRLAKSDNSYEDVRLLRDAIARLGMPEVIRGDNGKNYVSHHFQEVLERLGIVYVATTPFKGDEKGKVERSFKSLQHSAIFENLPGFIGHDPKMRIDIENQAVKKSQRGKKATNLKENMLWWWEMESLVQELVEKQEALAMHRPMSVEHLRALLGKRYVRRVTKEGVMINGRYYQSPEFWQEVWIGQEVEVIEDIDDESVAYVHIGGKAIAVTSRLELGLEEIKAMKRAYRSKAKRYKKLVREGEKELFAMQDAITAPHRDKEAPKPKEEPKLDPFDFIQKVS